MDHGGPTQDTTRVLGPSHSIGRYCNPRFRAHSVREDRFLCRWPQGNGRQCKPVNCLTAAESHHRKPLDMRWNRVGFGCHIRASMTQVPGSWLAQHQHHNLYRLVTHHHLPGYSSLVRTARTDDWIHVHPRRIRLARKSYYLAMHRHQLRWRCPQDMGRRHC